MTPCELKIDPGAATFLAAWGHARAAPDLRVPRPGSRAAYETFLAAHDLRGASVLELGCGDGAFLEHLQHRGIACRYTGFDLASEAAARGRARHPGSRFETGYFLDWVAPHSYDYVVSFGLDPGRAEGLDRAFERIARRACDLAGRAAHFAFRPTGHEARLLAMGLGISPHACLRHDADGFAITLYAAGTRPV